MLKTITSKLKTHNSKLAAILILAVLARVAVAFYLGDVVDAPPLLTDQRSYDALGGGLIAGRGFSFLKNWYPFTLAGAPTSHWSFLESLWVAAVYAVFGVHPLAVRLATAVLGGILLPWLVYRLARRLPFADATVTIHHSPFTISLDLPTLSALLAAVYFYFILYAATLMTETFFICALLWSLERALALAERLRAIPEAAPVFRESVGLSALRWLPERALALAERLRAIPRSAPVFRESVGFRVERVRRVALTLGLSLGIATLFRQSILPWVAVLFAWLLWLGWRSGQLRRAFLSLLVAGSIIALMILPFTIRNYRVYGQFLLLNSNAGYAMYSAQHPMHGTQFQEFAAAPLPADLVRGNEAQMDRDLMRRGAGFVLADPGRYLLLSLSRAAGYFQFWPSPGTTLINNVGRVGSFGLFLPFMLYGIYLSLRRSSGPVLMPLGLVLFFMAFYSLMHIFTWAMPRYRLPVDAVALPFAALALQDVLGRLLARFRPVAAPMRSGRAKASQEVMR